MKPLTPLELIRNFDQLPDDALVPPKVLEILTGMSEWTRRRNLNLPRVPISEHRYLYRAGDIRALVRGNPQSDSMDSA
jgi:hypothetical protein